MSAFQHVLATTDFGPASARSVRGAADLASKLGARLSVVHVVPPPPYPYPVPASDAAREHARGRLEDLVASLDAKGVESILLEGSPADEIVGVAKEIGADLVVIGSHGRRGALRALLGSVAERVVRLSPVPVLTLHPWRFEDRAEAGRELATATAHLRASAPAVVAISRGGLIVAGELARSFDERPDVLLATSVGRDGAVFGGICEDGTICLDPADLARAPLDPDRDLALHRARQLLAEESSELRGNLAIGDLWRRPVVVVTDALDEPWSMLAVCEVLRRLGASSLIVAAPVATWSACALLEGAVDKLVVIHTTDDAVPGASFYRDGRPIGIRAAARCLEEQTPRAGGSDGGRSAQW